MSILKNYIDNLKEQLNLLPLDVIEFWGNDFLHLWKNNKQLFICGNGGSAGNAIHLANDYLYGISPKSPPAMRVTALTANSSILTCLGNDVGYDAIFSEQLKTLGQSGDSLLVFSGSGNSPNVVEAIKTAKTLGITSYAIVGFSGGKCKELADHSIHIELDDMQISEDFQCIVGHMVMQWLHKMNPHARL
jgi:D-sedoheptulose 7-phosphate isomerase